MTYEDVSKAYPVLSSITPDVPFKAYYRVCKICAKFERP